MTSIGPTALLSSFFFIGMISSGKEPKTALPDKIEILGMNLIKVNPGKFTMGLENLHPSVEPYDGTRKVEITKPFYLAENEMTQAVWNLRMDENPSRFKILS